MRAVNTATEQPRDRTETSVARRVRSGCRVYEREPCRDAISQLSPPLGRQPSLLSISSAALLSVRQLSSCRLEMSGAAMAMMMMSTCGDDACGDGGGGDDGDDEHTRNTTLSVVH